MFRLALQMGCTVAELGERMTCSEFAEWAVWYSVDPFGDMRDDYRMAQLCTLLYNVNRGRNVPARKLSDFMLFRPFEAEPEPESDAAAGARLLAQLRAVQSAQRRLGR